MSRKIKDVKDKHTGELVYPRTHISAIVLSSDSTLEDLIEVKQDKLVSGENIKTINGESILGEGDLTVEGGAKVYTWNWDGSESGTLTQDEYDGIIGADIVYIASIGGIPTQTIMSKDGDYRIIILSQFAPQENGTILAVSFTIEINEDKSYNSNTNFAVIPTKTSQLENDSNFVSSDGLKTINGESIVGSGNIEISGGIDGDYLPSTGGTIDGELDVIGSIAADTVSSNRYENGGGTAALTISAYGLSLEQPTGAEILSVTSTGDGTKFLSDDGTYKTIDTSGGSGAYSEVNHGTADTTFTLTPNTFHIWDEVASLTLDFGSETSGVANEYLFQFTSGSTATTLSLPSDLKWANDSAPTIEPNMIYQVSVLKGLASVLEFSNAPSKVYINFTISNTPYVAEEGMTWSEWCTSAYNISDWRTSGNIVRTIGDSMGYYVISDVTPSSIIVNGSAYSSYFYSLDIP